MSVDDHFALLRAELAENGADSPEFVLQSRSFLEAHLSELEAAWNRRAAPESGEDMLKTNQDREAVVQWMLKNGYATGHGDTVEDLLGELEWQHRERHADLLSQLQTVERERDEALVGNAAMFEMTRKQMVKITKLLKDKRAAEASLLRLQERVREVVGPFKEIADRHAQKPFQNYPTRDSFRVSARLGDCRAAAALLLSLDDPDAP